MIFYIQNSENTIKQAKHKYALYVIELLQEVSQDSLIKGWCTCLIFAKWVFLPYIENYWLFDSCIIESHLYYKAQFSLQCLGLICEWRVGKQAWANNLTNLRQYNQPNWKHQKTIIIAQIIALGKIIIMGHRIDDKIYLANMICHVSLHEILSNWQAIVKLWSPVGLLARVCWVAPTPKDEWKWHLSNKQFCSPHVNLKIFKI